MSYKIFLERQEDIYSEFRDTSVLKKEGVVPKIPKNQGAYIIAFRYPEEITDKIAEFSHKVSQIVPSITYDKLNAHSTITVFGLKNNFSPDNKILNTLTQIVQENNYYSKEVVIDFDEWLLNQNTGIASGKPNKQFYEIMNRIVNYSYGRDLSMPWGTYISTNRFLKNVSPKKIKKLIKTFEKSKSLGKTKPDFIDVGYFVFSPEKFELITHECFKL